MSASASREERAVVAFAPDRRSVAPVELAGPGPGEVWIQTSLSGVSTGTDGWVMTGRFEWGGYPFPLVPGYQRAGIVTELGPGVAEFAVGQAVVATTTRGLTSAAAASGAHVSGGASPVEETFDATGIDPASAALFISAQVGYNAASRVEAAAGARIVVIGDGIIGASAALFAAARGFEVLLIGRHAPRLVAIEAGGVTVAISADASEVIGRWRPEAAIDTVQSVESAHAYLGALPARRGQVVFSGHTPDGALTWGDMAMMQKRELTAHFVSGWTAPRIESTLALLRAGAVPLGTLVSRVAGPAQEIEDVMDAVALGRLGGVAAVLDWRAGD